MFTNMPLWGIGTGFAAIAVGLFWLQMLRVRHRQIDVPTTIFWREAVEESRARVLRQRFRHPWAYLLFLAIALLLWLAVAGLSTTANQDQEYVLILDGSVGMNHEKRFDIAVEALLQDSEALPINQREVWWCGADNLLLLAKGEHSLLLKQRFLGLQPEATSSTLPARVLQLTQLRSSLPTLQVRIYGDSPFPKSASRLLPDSVEVVRVTALAPARSRGNQGFINGGISESASGDWSLVDVLVEVYGSKQAPQVTSKGIPLQVDGDFTTTSNGAVWLYRDIVARGQQLHFSLEGQDFYPADDNLTLNLPQRRPLQVLVSPSLFTLLDPLIAADSALVLATENADLVVRNEGESLGEDLPALVFSSAPARGHAIDVTYTSNENPAEFLQKIYAILGIAEVDALALAQQLNQSISLGVEQGPLRRILVWQPLLQSESGFRHSRSLPIFLGRSLRWLANMQPFPAVVETGHPLSHSQGDWRTQKDTLLVTAGLPLRPARAGLYRNPSSGLSLTASAFDRIASQGMAAEEDIPQANLVTAAELPLWSWLVLLALLLLMVEWFLFQAGRIP